MKLQSCFKHELRSYWTLHWQMPHGCIPYFAFLRVNNAVRWYWRGRGGQFTGTHRRIFPQRMRPNQIKPLILYQRCCGAWPVLWSCDPQPVVPQTDIKVSSHLLDQKPRWRSGDLLPWKLMDSVVWWRLVIFNIIIPNMLSCGDRIW